jgi:hypothetical protein
MKGYAILLEDPVLILLITYIFKNAARICPLYLSAFIYLKKIDAIDFIALATHHTSTLTL